MTREREMIKQHESIPDLIKLQNAGNNNSVFVKYATVKLCLNPTKNGGQGTGKPISVNCPACHRFIKSPEWSDNKCSCKYELTVENLLHTKKSVWFDLRATCQAPRGVGIQKESNILCNNTPKLGEEIIPKLSNGKFRTVDEFANEWISCDYTGRQNLINSLEWKEHTFEVKFKIFKQKDWLQIQIDTMKDEHNKSMLHSLGYKTDEEAKSRYSKKPRWVTQSNNKKRKLNNNNNNIIENENKQMASSHKVDYDANGQPIVFVNVNNTDNNKTKSKSRSVNTNNDNDNNNKHASESKTPPKEQSSTISDS